MNSLSYEEQLQLYSDNEALAEWFVTYMVRCDREDIDDIRQIAKVALWQACQEYDSEKSSKFSPFAVQKMEWLVKDYKRATIRRRSMETPLEKVVEKKISIEQIADCVSVSHQFEKWMDSLDEVDRQVVELKMQGLKNAEIARKLFVTPQRISNRLSKMRRTFPSFGDIEDE